MRATLEQKGKVMAKAPIEAEIRADLPDSGKAEWRDRETANLVMRGNKRGGVWYLHHRVDGKRIRDKLGRWPDLTVTAARKAAKALSEANAVRIAAGGDVLAERKAKRDAKAKRKAALTVGQVLDRYSADHLASLRTGDHAESVLRRVYSDVMTKSLADLTRADLIACTDARRATSPSAAEQAIRYCKPFMGWIAERGHGEDLLAGVKARQTRKRDRTLTLTELGRIVVALDDMGNDAPALVIRTLIATAGRLNEVSAMCRDEVKGDLWTLPPERNKSGRVHLVPLNAEARAAIAMSSENGGDLMFPGRNGPYNGWSRFKTRLDEASGVADWVFHDFRRSFASICADRGVDPLVADRVLNHAAAGTQSTVMRIYQRSEMLAQRRAALDIWAGAIADARAATLGGNVVQIGKGRA